MTKIVLISIDKRLTYTKQNIVKPKQGKIDNLYGHKTKKINALPPVPVPVPPPGAPVPVNVMMSF